MADNSLGLLFEIDADPSKAQAALGSLGPQVEQFGSRVTGSMAQPRESARLLSEVFGLHMPRAITSSIARMEEFQAVAELALGAGFAIFFAEKLVNVAMKFSDITKAADEFDKAAAKAFKEAGAAAEEWLTKFTTLKQGLMATAETQQHIEWVNRVIAAYRALADEAGGDLRKLGAMQPEMVRLIAEASRGHINSLDDARKRLGEYGALLGQQFGQTRKLEQEQFDADTKIINEEWALWDKADEAVKKRIRGWEEAQFHAAETLHRLTREFARQYEEELKAIAAEEKHVTSARSLAGQYQDVYKAVIAYRNQLRELPDVLLDDDEKLKALSDNLGAFTGIAEKSIAVINNQKIALAENAAAGVLNLVGARRAAAVVEAIWNTAEGFAALGHYDFWAAEQDFLAAAQYGIIAGTSTTRGGSGSSRALSSAAQGRVQGSSGGVSSGPAVPTTVSPTAPAIHFHIAGDLIAEDTIARLATRLSRAVYKGDVHLIASTTLGPSTPLS